MSGDRVALLSGIFLVALGTEKSSAMSSNVNLCGGQGFMDIYLFSAPSRPWMGGRKPFSSISIPLLLDPFAHPQGTRAACHHRCVDIGDNSSLPHPGLHGALF